MSGVGEARFAAGVDRLPVADALARLRAATSTVAGVETVPLDEARGRVLAGDVTAPRDLPAFANAAVDGFAFRHADLAAAGPLGLGLRPGRSAAGHPFGDALAAGEALRVLTGAVLPEPADTVAMQEDVRAADGRLVVPASLKPGANRRLAGEDAARGAVVLRDGTRLRPQEIALAAALGRSGLPVRARLRVALLSTGDELREPGPELPRGGVFDANRHMLKALLADLPVSVTDLGILPDEPSRVREALATAADHDAVLTSGGASAGDEDHVVAAVRDTGSLDFWRIAMKPGRPLAFGRMGRAVFVGLPGNPVAAFVCFLRFARPVLIALGGGGFPEPERYPLPADFDLAKKPGRTELLRGFVVRDAAGNPWARRIPRDGSGLVSVLVEARGLIEVGADSAGVRRGDPVDYLPFSGFGLPAA